MIPPSTLFIIYAIFTETSIGRLFLAGVIPGLITAFVYVASIIFRVRKKPSLAPVLRDKDFSWNEKIAALKQVWSVTILAFVVLGGIYVGIFTVTEGAAIGCAGAVLIGIITKGLKKLDLFRCLRDTANTTAMTFFIIIGALFFARFLAMSQIPVYLSEFLIGLKVAKEIIILAIFAMYFVLGMLIVPSGMMAITLPVVFPIVLNLGYDPIWFGVIIMKASEIAAVTPPVGLNVYVLKGVVGRDATLEEIFNGIWPFVICDLIVLGLLILFPRITLWLPDLILGN
jgi:tripartite ATP-independent transporter DctM subunit